MPACWKTCREKGWAEWRAGMKALAAQPNVVSKTSALGTFIHRNDPAHIAAVTRETVAIFGAQRYHVRLEFSDREDLDLVRGAGRRAPRTPRRNCPRRTARHLLHDTAMRVYRLA